MLGNIQRRVPLRCNSRGISAGSEERGAAVAVATLCCQDERSAPLHIPGVNVRRAHLLLLRAPDEHRHTRQVPLLGGGVKAGERIAVVLGVRGPCSQKGLHHGVMPTLTRGM